MTENGSKQSGFSIIGSVVVSLVLVAIVAVGFLVYQQHKIAKPKAAINTTQNTNQQAGKTGTQAQADPYKDWKTYCDTSHHYCFKYPTEWTVDASTDQVTVLNPTKSVEVDYINPYVHDSGLLTFSTVLVSNFVSSGANLKIVGGVYSPANEPDYAIVDASLLTSYPLTVGQSTQFPNALRFTDIHAPSSADAAFRARATSPMGTQAAAQAWFTSQDAKTSLLILQSLTYQP